MMLVAIIGYLQGAKIPVELPKGFSKLILKHENLVRIGCKEPVFYESWPVKFVKMRLDGEDIGKYWKKHTCDWEVPIDKEKEHLFEVEWGTPSDITAVNPVGIRDAELIIFLD